MRLQIHELLSNLDNANFRWHKTVIISLDIFSCLRHRESMRKLPRTHHTQSQTMQKMNTTSQKRAMAKRTYIQKEACEPGS